jgi:hypothetical protein
MLDFLIIWVQIVASVCLVYIVSRCRVQIVATLAYRMSLNMLTYVYSVYKPSQYRVQNVAVVTAGIT